MKYPVCSPVKRWELLKQYIRHGYMDTDTHLLGEYAEALNLPVSRKISLSFLYSTCYNVPTACLLYELLGNTSNWNILLLEEVWETYKHNLIFQTDRKWVKIANQFIDLCLDFKENMYPFTKGIKPYIESFDDMYNQFSVLKNQGRVTTYIFIDGLIATGIMKPCMPERFDWNNCQTCTEGMLHALCLDEQVDHFDKGKHKLNKEQISVLDSGLNKLILELRKEGLDEEHVCDYESNLCAYRKYFKGTMYHGYYLDRQLEELYKLSSSLPEHEKLWDNLFMLRKSVYPANLLGELNDWRTIRKYKMKNFLDTGVMDVDS